MRRQHEQSLILLSTIINHPGLDEVNLPQDRAALVVRNENQAAQECF